MAETKDTIESTAEMAATAKAGSPVAAIPEETASIPVAEQVSGPVDGGGGNLTESA
jgi:hypothetical protein